MTCQLQHIDELCRDNSFPNGMFQFFVRAMKRAKARSVSTFAAIIEFAGHRNESTRVIPQPAPLKPGDLVRVRSRREIKRTLSMRGELGGCHFMRDMVPCCGKTFVVLKVVDHFYDEVSQRLRKTRETVLLDGATCSGKQRMYNVQCERTCFFFWRTAWLEKIGADRDSAPQA